MWPRASRIVLVTAAAAALAASSAPVLGAEYGGPPAGQRPVTAGPGNGPPGGVASVPYGATPQARVSDGTPKLCGRYDWKWVHWYHNWYAIRNDDFADYECINNAGDGPNYRVSNSSANSLNHENQAFPHIFEGCSWGICTPGTGLPYPWIGLRHVYATVSAYQHATGLWNSAFDIWFGQQRHKTGQAQGTELMIWLAAGGARSGPAPIVTIDGARWYLHHWRACNVLGCWHYIQFWRVQPTSWVKQLDLVPFFRYASRPGTGATRHNMHGVALAKNWYLWNVEFGNEIWRGGNGLGVQFFRVRGLPRVPFTPPKT